jgi:hypothetical protein
MSKTEPETWLSEQLVPSSSPSKLKLRSGLLPADVIVDKKASTGPIVYRYRNNFIMLSSFSVKNITRNYFPNNSR